MQQINEGVIDYFRHHTDWEVLYRPGPSNNPKRFSYFPEVAGIITQSRTPEMIEAIGKLSLPVVLVERDPIAGFVTVRGDDRAIGRRALEHLAEKGIGRVSFWGMPGHYYSDQREDGFYEEARKEGIEIFPQPGSRWAGRVDPVAYLAAGAMEAYLDSLPSPAGILAAYLTQARELVRASKEMGLFVPEQIAVLGVDNDVLTSKANSPSLTTIDQGTYQIGYQAGAVLHHWIQHARPPVEVVLIPPKEVIERQSTDTLAVEDPLLARAIRYIRRNAVEGINVQDVLRAVPVARRSLEKAFRQTLDRSIHQEIVRVRVEEAKKLLMETTLPMPDIAARCGFSYATVMSKVFRQVTGTTPNRFRRTHRP
jgi:LacI family transcriptional regulator